MPVPDYFGESIRGLKVGGNQTVTIAANSGFSDIIVIGGYSNNTTIGYDFIAGNFNQIQYFNTLNGGPLIQYIRTSAFSICNALGTVNISSTRNIECGDGIFNLCTSLTSVTFASTNITCGDRTFNGCTSLSTVNIPGIVSLGADTFLGCTNLTSVSLDGLPTVPSNLISGLSTITSVSFNSATIIEQYAFRVNSFSSVELPKVTTVGMFAFSSCSLLTTIKMSLATDFSAGGAFFNCTSLVAISSISLPAAVNIGASTFEGCTNLTYVILPTVTIISYQAFTGCANVSELVLNSLTTLDIRLITGFINSLKYVSFSALPVIPNNAFENYTKLGMTRLDTSSFNSAISVGTRAFSGCTSLGIIYLPSAQTIGDYAFSGCTLLNGFRTFIDIINGIPAILQFVSAITIGSYTFSGCTSLTNISLINATTFGSYAFNGCTALNTVSAIKLTVVGNYAFNGCSSLSTFSFPELTSISEGAFAGCTSITNINSKFPNVRTIGVSGFSGCTGLTTPNFPLVTHILPSAFNGCSSLTTITITNITSISKVGGSSPFTGCTALTKLYIGNNGPSLFAIDTANPDPSTNRRYFGTTPGPDVYYTGTHTWTATDLQQININHAYTDQTITFFLQPTVIYNPQLILPLTGTTTSGLPITYTSSNTAIATIIDSSLNVITTGSIVITASQPGNDSYTPAPDVSQAITIQKDSQTIQFVLSPNTYDFVPGKIINLSATAVSVNYPAIPILQTGPSIVFTSSDPTIASIVGTSLIFLTAGSVNVTASRAGNANYNAPTDVIQGLTINKLSQAITFDISSNFPFPRNPITLTGTTSAAFPPPLTVTYTVSDPTRASVTGNILTVLLVGTFTITAHQAGNVNYNPAPSIPRIVTTTRTQQTINFVLNPNTYQYFSGLTVNLTGTTSSGLPINYVSSNPNIVSIVGSVINVLFPGTMYITAYQNGNENYFPAVPVQKLLKIIKIPQQIAFNLTNTIVNYQPGLQIDLSPMATSTSLLPVSFASLNAAVGTITGTSVSIINSGKVKLVAYQGGNDYYAPAQSVSQLLTVLPNDKVITFEDITSDISNGYYLLQYIPDYMIQLVAYTSSLDNVIFSSSNTNIATVLGSTLSIIGSGIVTIYADSYANMRYNAAPTVSQTLKILQTPSDISFNALPTVTYSPTYTLDLALYAFASNNLPITFASSNTNIAIINGSILTLAGIAVGLCRIDASQPGNVEYMSADPVYRILRVLHAPQVLTFNIAPDLYYMRNYTIVLDGVATSDLPITYTSSNPSIVSVNGSILTVIRPGGPVTIGAQQLGSPVYLPSNIVQRTITVHKGNQSITFEPLPITIYRPGYEFILNASASSGLPITFVSSDPSVVRIEGGIAYVLSIGQITITAEQDGDAIYFNAAQPVLRELLIINDPHTPFSFIKENLSSGMTDLVQNTVLECSVELNVPRVEEVPVYCCAKGPVISPYSGGNTSGGLLAATSRLCVANSNRPIIPTPPPLVRFAQYQRMPPPAVPMPPPPGVIIPSNPGVPLPPPGPCVNVIGIVTSNPATS